MNENGAPLLVENLAPGLTPDGLVRAEADFGFSLPQDLCALWSLNNGQFEEGNPFIECYDLLSVEEGLAEQETVQMCIDFCRESADLWKQSGGTKEELESSRWVPFAAIDSDTLVVHGDSGRVFRCDHDDSPQVLAPSLATWFEQFADRVEADDYAVCGGRLWRLLPGTARSRR